MLKPHWQKPDLRLKIKPFYRMKFTFRSATGNLNTK